MHFRRAISAVCAILLAAPAGCTRTSDVSSRGGEPLARNDLTPAQEKLAARALEARDALFQTLLAELSGAMQEGGPTSAITVCKNRAPQIAGEIGEKMGLKIGRTSFRLRNPANTPPTWAKKLVEKRVSEPSYVDLKDQGLGIFLPIVTAAPCLKCHGEKDAIDGAVKETLAANYPLDEATGFRAGGLRGWFWIEVPPAPPEK